MDYLLENLEEIEEIREVILITNAKFRESFIAWQKKASFTKSVKILHDSSTSNENRLGAIRDLDLVIEQERLADDILVMAGDNLFHFSIRDFVQAAKKNRPDITIGCVDVGTKELAKRYGVMGLDSESRLTSFLEKPVNPTSTLVSMGLYFFTQPKLGRIREYLKDRENADAPGFFIRWLLDREILHGFSFAGIWYDIGDLTSYNSANQLFQQPWKGKEGTENTFFNQGGSKE